MSQSRTKSDAKIVEKYLKEFPTLDRTPLARLIRAENPQFNTTSGRRRLDRILRKVFSKLNTTIHFRKDTGPEVRRELIRDYKVTLLKEEDLK